MAKLKEQTNYIPIPAFNKFYYENRMQQFKKSSLLTLLKDACNFVTKVFTCNCEIQFITKIKTKPLPTINFFINNIQPKNYYGGLLTILKLIAYCSQQERPIRIILLKNYILPYEINFMKMFLLNKMKIDIKNISNITITTNRIFQKHIIYKISLEDVLIATYWETAYLTADTLKKRKFKKKHFFYIIQDFEPGFFPWSMNYILALNTYKFTNYKPIVNSNFLAKYLEKNHITTRNYLVFKPCIEEIPTPVEKSLKRHTAKIKIIFYARPSVERNAFPLILKALEQWLLQESNIHSKIAEICGIGESFSPIIIKGIQIKSLGKLSPENYKSTLKNFNIGISLMLSPHPSYPPLEMAKSGLITITNSFSNKDLSKISKNIISCKPTVEDIVSSLQIASKSIKNIKNRIKNSNFEIPGLALPEVARIISNNNS